MDWDYNLTIIPFEKQGLVSFLAEFFKVSIIESILSCFIRESFELEMLDLLAGSYTYFKFVSIFMSSLQTI